MTFAERVFEFFCNVKRDGSEDRVPLEPVVFNWDHARRDFGGYDIGIAPVGTKVRLRDLFADQWLSSFISTRRRPPQPVYHPPMVLHRYSGTGVASETAQCGPRCVD